MNKIKELLARFVGFIKSALSESDGQGSYTRFSGMLIILAAIAWVTYLVFKTHSMPDMSGVTVFVSGGAGGQYAINKGEDIVNAIRGRSTDPKPADK